MNIYGQIIYRQKFYCDLIRFSLYSVDKRVAVMLDKLTHPTISNELTTMISDCTLFYLLYFAEQVAAEETNCRAGSFRKIFFYGFIGLGFVEHRKLFFFCLSLLFNFLLLLLYPSLHLFVKHKFISWFIAKTIHVKEYFCKH